MPQRKSVGRENWNGGAVCRVVQHVCTKLIWASVLAAGFSCNERLFEGEPAQVSGTVAVDGTALSSGRVTFHHRSSGRILGSTIEPGGKYTLTFAGGKDVPPGAYQVTVSPIAKDLPIASETVNSPSQGSLDEQVFVDQSEIPEAYHDVETTELKARVVPGSNVIDFDLKPTPSP